MKFHLIAALSLSLPQAYDSAAATSKLSASGRALLESKIDQLDANAKRCLVAENADQGLCQEIIDPLLASFDSNSDDYVISEASYEAESPAPLEGDNLGSDMGEPQVIETQNQEDIVKIIFQAREYMQEVVMKDPKYEKVRTICTNDNAQCAFWASVGECEKNPAYMKGKRINSFFQCSVSFDSFYYNVNSNFVHFFRSELRSRLQIL